MINFNSNSLFSTIPPVTRNILIINFAVWLLCYLCGQMVNILGLHYLCGQMANILGLHYFQSKGFYLYQFITYMFTHESFSHLFFNMFALFMFGGVVERIWGPQRYLSYYLITGIGAGLIQMLVSYIQVRTYINRFEMDGLLSPSQLTYLYNSIPVTIGASGAIFGLLLAFGMLFPNAPIYFMLIPIPIKAKYFVAGYGLIEFFFGISNRTGDNVAHFAHLGGMLFGIIMILYWRKRGTNNGRNNF
ncbi:MAG: rhomboid family intramembrane serine protease [Candidatus Azobacteroides sp.]|nr:rhomboid family intramembrane serine protease [Candidatus Azobacteroides sp.]